MSLTDDDKKWLTSRFDILDAKIEAKGRELEAKIDSKGRELEEKIEATETKLLTAFYDWASPMEKRLRSHTAAIEALDAELEHLKSRVSKLEHPPQ